jgi:hypothetical protein
LPSQNITNRQVKCPHCEKYFNRKENEFKYFKNRYWHLSCYNNRAQEEEEKQKLINYIEKLLHKKVDYKIQSQLKNYLDKEFGYKEIYQALYFFYEIKNNSIEKANGGIGIVPYVIEEAKAYFKNKEIIKKSMSNAVTIISTKKIIIPDPTKKIKNTERKNIDISEI